MHQADGWRPLIGVTMYRQIASWGPWRRDAALAPGAYLDLVEAAGGQPVLLPPGRGAGTDVRAGPGAKTGRPSPDGDGLVDALGALVLIGGGDVGPRRYGHQPDPRTGVTSERRDEQELGLLRAALRRDLPVLAICRGFQLLNVLLGGDLVQHLPDLVGGGHQPRAGAFAGVAVATVEGTRTRELLGPQLDVRCSHHQAIGRLGTGLTVGARSADGVIEAVELPDHRFVVGVQWHPEESGDVRLFGALVGAALGDRRQTAPAAGDPV